VAIQDEEIVKEFSNYYEKLLNNSHETPIRESEMGARHRLRQKEMTRNNFLKKSV